MSTMVVALSQATADGRTLLGHNHARPANEAQFLVRTAGQHFTLGEVVVIGDVTLPQVRQTWTVLAGRSADSWGYAHGVNECGLAAATTSTRRRLASDSPGLTGPDLVRLVLERAGSARQGIDLACDLVGRHGQGTPQAGDCNLLIADAAEAYLLAAAGSHWAVQEMQSVRAVTGLCHLRQDWDRVSRGLCDVVLERGWWPEDGSKIDFEGTVGAGGSESTELRRWAHATLQLEDQNGHIDSLFLRRLLADHYEDCLDETDPLTPCADDNTLCLHPVSADGLGTASSFIIECPRQGRPLAWCAFGPPCLSVYFPLVVDGDLPPEFTGDGLGTIDNVWHRLTHLTRITTTSGEQRAHLVEALTQLQNRFDRVTEEYLEEMATRVRPEDRHSLATAFLRHNYERFEDTWLNALEVLGVELDVGRPTRRGVAAMPV